MLRPPKYFKTLNINKYWIVGKWTERIFNCCECNLVLVQGKQRFWTICRVLIWTVTIENKNSIKVLVPRNFCGLCYFILTIQCDLNSLSTANLWTSENLVNMCCIPVHTTTYYSTPRLNYYFGGTFRTFSVFLYRCQINYITYLSLSHLWKLSCRKQYFPP